MEALGVKVPAFDRPAVIAATKEHPIWVHFGAGNIFRGFVAALQQRLLNEGESDKGIIAGRHLRLRHHRQDSTPPMTA